MRLGGDATAGGSLGVGKGGMSQSHQLGKLQPYLASTLQQLLQGVEQAAIADFNDWLVRSHVFLLRLTQIAQTSIWGLRTMP